MTEHNLPDKDDAPWLDCMDGFRGEYEPRNREKARAAHRTLFWCGKCDAQIVSQSEKCPNCGHRENRSKIRIPPI